MQEIKHSLPYSKELDGLRGVAILLVLLFHFWPQYFSFGFVGVDIFFVLSGYLISTIIITKLQNDSFNVLTFYRNRIRRIFPSMILVLASTWILGYFFLYADELKQLSKHVLSSSFFIQNITLSKEVGYWDTSAQLKPLLHFWSLSIEEQFYIFWPVVLVFLYRFKLLFLIGPLLVFSFIGSVFIEDETKAFFTLSSRVWELIFGAYLAWLKNKYLLFGMPKWGRFLGWALLFCSLYFSIGSSVYNPFIIVLVVASTSVLILSSLSHPDKFLSNKIFHSLGLISFPLYLWHYPLLSFRNILSIEIVGIEFYLLFISVFLAWISYRYVEVMSRQQNSWYFSGALLFIVLIIASVAGYTENSDGLSMRPHIIEIKDSTQQLVREKPSDDLCDSIIGQTIAEKRLFHYCRSNSENINDKFIAIIGDSHAHVLYSGFSEILAEEGYKVIMLANSSCPSLIGGGRGKNLALAKICSKKIDQIFKVLDKLPNAFDVIIATRGPTYAYETGYGIIEKKWTESPTHYSEYFLGNPIDYNPSKTFFKTVSDTVAYLINQGRRVFYFLENPELGFHAKSCVERPFGIFTGRCSISFVNYQLRMSSYRENAIKVIGQFTSATILDPEPFLCDAIFCYVKNDGKLMYADGDHFSKDGSKYIAKKLVPIILRKK